MDHGEDAKKQFWDDESIENEEALDASILEDANDKVIYDEVIDVDADDEEEAYRFENCSDVDEASLGDEYYSLNV